MGSRQVVRINHKIIPKGSPFRQYLPICLKEVRAGFIEWDLRYTLEVMPTESKHFLLQVGRCLHPYTKSKRCHILSSWIVKYLISLGCLSKASMILHSTKMVNHLETVEYLSLPPTRHDLTQGQKPEGRLKWG